jgi:acyl phosphate:glycerol-3-phosphate acyltransferase
MRYLTWFLIGYLLGSIPTAYIFVKVFNGIDIRKAGSGNVGALNAYEVSGSPLIGLSVLLIDVMKGYFCF